MSNSNRRHSVWTSLCAGLVLMTGMIVHAQRAGGPDAPWRDLESELRQQGLQTDTRSLIEIARSERDSGTRWLAIEILGLRQESAAGDALRQVLAETNDRLLKESSALALARLGDETGRRAIETLMPTAVTLERRTWLATRLAEFGDPAGYRFVAEAITSKDPQQRYLAAGALTAFVPLEGRGSDPPVDARRRMLDLLQDPDAAVRKEVLLNVLIAVNRGLPQAEARRIVEKLAQDDPDVDVREMARLTLIAWPKAGLQ